LINLNLSYNEIEDISLLYKLMAVTNLHLFENKIIDISPLQNLTEIQKLVLNKNKISNISVLENFNKLEELYLANNQIKDISILSNLKNLTNIGLYNNQINDISSLAKLWKIKWIFAGKNNIKDISPIKDIFSKKEISFNFEDNPITTPPIVILEQGKEAIKNWFENKENKNRSKTKILFLTANPTDQARLQTGKEYRIIKEKLLQSTQRDSLELLMPEFALKIDNLLTAMNQKPAIIHFSGHGEINGIAITNDLNETILMPNKALQRLFKQHKETTKLIVLNACYSSEQAKTISEFGFYVVGMNTTINDNAAISFASGLYMGLGAGKKVEKAFDDAMVIMETEYPNMASTPEIWKNGKKLEEINEIKLIKFNEEKSDTNIKFQIRQFLLVEGTFTKEQFEREVQKLANELKVKKGKYNSKQKIILIHFFDNKKRALHHWFSMYEYNMLMNNEKFSYNETLMSSFDNGNKTYTVPSAKEITKPQQFGSIKEMLTKHGDYSISQGTLKVISNNHIQISDKCVKDESDSVIEENVKRGLVYIVYRIFIHTNTKNIIVDSIPLQIVFTDKSKFTYLKEYKISISIDREFALQILKEKVEINNFEELVETDNNDSANRYFNSMLHNDAEKPTLNIIWKELEKFIVEENEDFYVPERDIPSETLESAVKNLTWNIEQGRIERYDNTYDRYVYINSLDDLVEYLEEEIVQALHAEMPSEWLKEQSNLDYETEVKEFLNEKFLNNITDLGWDKDL